MLAWDYSMLYSLDREWFQDWHFNWSTNERLKFCYDRGESFDASHHQKFVVIDGISVLLAASIFAPAAGMNAIIGRIIHCESTATALAIAPSMTCSPITSDPSFGSSRNSSSNVGKPSVATALIWPRQTANHGNPVFRRGSACHPTGGDQPDRSSPEPRRQTDP